MPPRNGCRTFPAPELAATPGSCPVRTALAGRPTHGAIGRGSPRLKWIVIEIIQTHKLAPGLVDAHYQKLRRAKGKPKATVAAARKFCTYLYWMLKEGWPPPSHAAPVLPRT
jgi:hypothetical protein